jgi:Na+/melibiose symporter-like transporter
MPELFAERNARIYLLGQTVSLIGDRMLWLSMGIWVKALTGSNGEAGLAFFFMAFPSLFAPLCGSLIDRLPRRRLLLWTNLATALVVTSLVLVNGRGQVWLIYLVMFLYGSSNNVLGGGSLALVRMLVDDDLLGEANAYLSTVQEGCRLFAPLLGAGLYTVLGGGVLGLVDGATFLVAVASLLLITVQELPQPSEHEDWRDYTMKGLTYLWRCVPLRQSTVATAVTLLMAGILESIGFAVVSQGLHRAPGFLGVISTVQGVGAVPGALTAAALMRRTGAGVMVAIGLMMLALGCLVLTQDALVPVMAGCALMGCSLPWIIVGFNTAIQRLTPLDMQGRVDSTAGFLVGMPQSISIAVGAGLVTWIDYRLLLVIMALVIAGSGVWLGTRREQTRDALEAAAQPARVEMVPLSGV